MKYTNHPSILTIGKVCKERSTSPFSFSEVCKEEILGDILHLGPSKTCQGTDVLTRVIKENADMFAKFQNSNFNESVKNSKFLSALKEANIAPVFNTFSPNQVYYVLIEGDYHYHFK